MLNEMFERGDTLVTERTIYSDKKRGKTLAQKTGKQAKKQQNNGKKKKKS